MLHDFSFLWDLGGSMLRVSTPLIFAALGGLFSERSGVTNIALEGMMLLGAFVGAVCALFFCSDQAVALFGVQNSESLQNFAPWIGLLGAGISGAILAFVYGIFVISARANQIITATAVNMFVIGVTPFLCKVFYDSSSSSPQVPLAARFVWTPMVLALLLVVGLAYGVQRTAPGLWLRIAGEHPDALATAGISVKKVRYFAVILSGISASLGGAVLSICLSSGFSRGMTAGRGFVALAALILGKWRPIPTTVACLLLGLFDAVQIRLQGVTFANGVTIPVQFIQILPYFVTVLVLAGFVGRQRAPSSLGRPL